MEYKPVTFLEESYVIFVLDGITIFNVKETMLTILMVGYVLTP